MRVNSEVNRGRVTRWENNAEHISESPKMTNNLQLENYHNSSFSQSVSQSVSQSRIWQCVESVDTVTVSVRSYMPRHVSWNEVIFIIWKAILPRGLQVTARGEINVPHFQQEHRCLPLTVARRGELLLICKPVWKGWMTSSQPERCGCQAAHSVRAGGVCLSSSDEPAELGWGVGVLLLKNCSLHLTKLLHFHKLKKKTKKPKPI